MSLLTSQDLWYFIAAFCVLIVTGFLAWALYEIARLIHQANLIVSETRHKVENLGERLAGLSKYLGLAIEGGREAISYLQQRHQKTKRRKAQEKLEEEG